MPNRPSKFGATAGALARAWAAAAARVGGGHPLAVYAFGKHPAFADFLDVARLPPVPAAFRHFHNVLRPAVERDGGPAEPTVIAWRERGDAAVLWVQPSRDRGDAAGHVRRCPLLLGVGGRGDLTTLVASFGGRLAGLAEQVLACDGEAVFPAIARAAAEWPTASAPTGEPAGAAGRALVAVRAVGDGPVVVVATAAAATVEAVPLSSGSAAALQARLSAVR